MRRIPALAVLASGNGSNLQAILDECAAGKIPAAVRLVLSDREEAYALERARRAGVEAGHVCPASYPSREEFDLELVRRIRGKAADWVVLAGFMRILTPKFVGAFRNRILNIHPAKLPLYPGTHAIERAYAGGERSIGVTVHFVDEGVDSGEIVLQETLEVGVTETLEAVTARVHTLEHRLFPEALRRVIGR